MFGNTSYHIIQFDVMAGWVSFHHSLHWLLAELFKHVDILSEDSLKEVGLSSVREIVLRNASERAMLTVIDFPLRGEQADFVFLNFYETIPGHSPRDDRANSHWFMGSQRVRHPRTTSALPRLYAPRALL
jgi:hypothetical protein